MWTASNKPAGDWMVSHWASGTEVAVVTDEHTVVRKRDKTSSYQVDDKTFTAFGAAVPDEVQKALCFQDSNLAEQLDAPFLISLPDSQIAQYFNRIIGLEQVDATVAEVNRRAKVVSSQIKQKEGAMNALKEKLNIKASLAKMEEAVALWEETTQEQLRVAAQIVELEKLLIKAKTVGITCPIELDEATKIVNEEAELSKKINLLDGAIRKATVSKRKYISSLAELNELEANTPLCDKCGKPL